MKIDFEVIGLPKAQARPRVVKAGGKIMTYSPKTSWYQLVYWAAVQHRAKTVLSGPLKMEITLILPIPTSWSKKKKAAAHYVSVRPDLDNYAKAILDAFNNACVWQDDGQVAELIIRKIYGAEPKAVISVEELENKAEEISD